MGWTGFFIWIFIITSIFQPIIFCIFYGGNYTNEVPCYDKYSNEIIGQRCIAEKIYLTDSLIVMLLINFAFELLIILMGVILWIEW